MAKGIYVGVNGTPRKVKSIYVGVNNAPRKVKEVYVGVGGVPKKVYSATVPAGQVIFTSSQIWTVPEGVKTLDVFIVGGGGMGWHGGGGGGRTNTIRSVPVTAGQQIAVTVGAGATTISSYDENTIPGTLTLARGGQSVFGGYVADGGDSGIPASITWNDGYSTHSYASGCAGNGGSGGGGAGWSSDCLGGNGGANGANGDSAWNYYQWYNYPPANSGYDGTRVYGLGQGISTKAFGEADGTLYAGGGGGSGWSGSVTSVGGNGGGGGWSDLTTGQSGTPNTGGGGAGSVYNFNPCYGGSGIVIVRWKEQ
jgi:hypothetical protein